MWVLSVELASNHALAPGIWTSPTDFGKEVLICKFPRLVGITVIPRLTSDPSNEFFG